MLGFDFIVGHSQHVGEGKLRSRSKPFTVKFWGVRGNIPTPGMETIRYGGNTACMEMQVGGQRLIFDGGTGLRALGKQWLQETPIQGHILFTNTYWDRIQGFPFFAPAFIEGNQFDIYGSMGANGASIKQRLSGQMLRPNFPIPLQKMRSRLQFHNVAPGSVIELDQVTIETVALNCPDGSLGYRVSWNGASVVYATGTDHAPGQLDQGLLDLARQADLLVYDAAYFNQAYPAPDLRKQPTTWYAAVELAIAAQVNQVVLFHHDPTHDDDFLDRVEREVQAEFPHVQLAREGMSIEVMALQTCIAAQG